MKKIAMIIPSLLLTGCLFGCGNKEVDPFVIADADSFNKAVSFAGVNYLQTATMQLIYIGTSFSTTSYLERYMSPNVYYQFDRFSYDKPGMPSEQYVEKTPDGKYYLYTVKEGTWGKEEDPRPDDFRTPQKEGDLIKYILGLGSVDYNLIKDKYDKERQSYYFNAHNVSDVNYDTIMSFYNNRLIYFSYCHYDELNKNTELAIFNYTYGTINPKLPIVPEP